MVDVTIDSGRIGGSAFERTLVDDLPVGVLIADRQGRVVAANGAWRELTGQGPPDSVGDGWATVLDAGDRARLHAELVRVVERGVDASIDCRLRGEPCRWVRWRLRRRDDHDAPGVVMAVIDVTADRDREAVLSHRATHDGLTGLVSRDEFLLFVERALRRRQRHRDEVVVVFVDLDGFKAVNDRGGHLLGDRVLAAVGHRLRDAVRPEDVVARVGGDEFAVLCADMAGNADAAGLAERIRVAFAAPIDVDGTLWSVGATVGVALAEEEDFTAEAIIGAADDAMYQAKMARRPSVRSNGSQRVADTSARIDMAARALRRTAQEINDLAVAQPGAGPRAAHLLDAAYSTYRAMLALDDARSPSRRRPGDATAPASRATLRIHRDETAEPDATIDLSNGSHRAEPKQS